MVNEYLGQWHSMVVFIGVPVLKCTKVKLNIYYITPRHQKQDMLVTGIGLML